MAESLNFIAIAFFTSYIYCNSACGELLINVVFSTLKYNLIFSWEKSKIFTSRCNT
jgi:hypothetical protein